MQNATTKTAVAIQAQAFSYASPRLVSYGRVNDLTASGSGLLTELENGNSRTCKADPNRTANPRC